MQILPEKVIKDKISEVITQHGDEYITWRMSSFDRTTILNVEGIFKDVNGYLETIPQHIQKDIYDIYAEIYEVMEFMDDFIATQNVIRNLINRLFELLNLEKLEHYCGHYAKMHYPLDLKPNYSDEELANESKRILTYLRSDYSGLLFLGVALRFIVPIWGQYIYTNRNTTPNVSKEYSAVSLIGESSIYYRPEMVRLYGYVKTKMGNATIDPTAIHAGLGTAEFPDWLLSKVIIKRLSMADLNNSNVNLISNIYNFLNTLIEGIGKNFPNKIREKPKPRGGDEDADNASLVENYKVKQTVNDSFTVILDWYAEDPVRLALEIQPDIDVRIVNYCVNKLQREGNLDIKPFRVQLCSLLMKDVNGNQVIPPRGLHSMSYNSLLNVVGVCQAIYHHLGQETIAHLLTVKGRDHEVGVLYGDGYTGESRARIKPDLSDQLMNMYPHYRRMHPNKDRTKNDNVGIQYIERINRETQDYQWIYNSPNTLYSGEVLNGKTFKIPTDFKNILARLLIELLGPKKQTVKETV